MDIIYTHCSSLILIAEFKLKMSRSYCSYDEDWQRRKSVLIRSLFHDIPILSPVDEESNDSSHDYYVPTQEVFPSPPRPYSPLPPLIIEKIPITNKHDEPEEYYRKLHKRIKKIYENLFIEERNVSSVDFGSNYNDGSINEDSQYDTEGSIENLICETENDSPGDSNFKSIVEDREARLSSASTNSNGYGADFESMDTVVIDVVNHSVSNEDTVMISEEGKSDNENIDDDGIRYEGFGNCRSSENRERRTYRMDDGAITERDESHHSTVYQSTTESEEPDKTGIKQTYGPESSDNETIDNHEIMKETSRTRQTNTSVIVDLEVKTGEESHHSIINDQEMSKSDEYNKREYNIIKADRNSDNQESKREKFTRTRSERKKELIASNDEPMESDVETSQSSEGPYYRQITTEALIHFDGFQVPGDRESIVYEGSVKSIILPTRYRRMLASRNVDVEDRIEVYKVLEENADPKIATTFNIDEHETTDEDLEDMTTSHPDTTFENDEEMSTHQSDAFQEDDETMSGPQSDASARNFEAIGQTGAIKKDDEEMDAHESGHSEEIDTNQLETVNKEIEERGKIDLDDTVKENEAWQPNDAGDHIGEMRTPGLETIEEDDEEVSVHQAEEEVDVDIDVTGSSPSDVSDKSEAKKASRLDDCDIEEIIPTQRDLPTVATFEKETAHPNTTDEDHPLIRTRILGTNEEQMIILQTEVTGEEVEEMRTPPPKATKKQMRIKALESTMIKTEIHQSAATDDEEETESPHSIEQMRTPRPDLSHGSIPVSHRSNSASTTEHTALPQELSGLTTSIQDGADTNMSELQTSNDNIMNKVLASIFSDSQNNGKTPISGKKRKLVDKSVQAAETSRVTWEEMRANFFVGTPKIFRLCACTDHICS